MTLKISVKVKGHYMRHTLWCFEVQCDSTSYRSPEEAPAAITFGLPDVHPLQNQTEPQALCVDSWQAADVRVSDVVWKVYLRDDPADPGRDLQ